MTYLARLAAILAVAAGIGGAGGAVAQKRDAVRFGTNWVAQAEHGGYYQAVADGTYARYNLDVTIVPGGPQANNRMMLPVGRIDFYMGGNMLQAFDAVKENIPTLVVAAIFQKEPQVLLAHPGQGFDASRSEEVERHLRLEGGPRHLLPVDEDGVRFSGGADQALHLQRGALHRQQARRDAGLPQLRAARGEKQGGFKPVVHLLADNGFDTYSTTIEGRREMVEKQPDVVQRFVDASVIGWANYLYGDREAANAAIKRDNPEMTDEQIAYSISKMKEYGIVDSGDAQKLGIGAMTDARMKSFFDKMVKAGLFKADLDYQKSYTLQFVNKGVGLDIKPKQ
jgi:NitT/TauT family transport system substrate-binding protein